MEMKEKKKKKRKEKRSNKRQNHARIKKKKRRVYKSHFMRNMKNERPSLPNKETCV